MNAYSARAKHAPWLIGLLAMLPWRRRQSVNMAFTGTRWRGLLPY